MFIPTHLNPSMDHPSERKYDFSAHSFFHAAQGAGKRWYRVVFISLVISHLCFIWRRGSWEDYHWYSDYLSASVFPVSGDKEKALEAVRSRSRSSRRCFQWMHLLQLQEIRVPRLLPEEQLGSVGRLQDPRATWTSYGFAFLWVPGCAIVPENFCTSVSSPGKWAQ